MKTQMKRGAAALIAAAAIAIPAAAPAAPPGDTGGHSAAVRACVEYRQIIGHGAFQAAFKNIRGCVDMVVPTVG